MQVPVDVKKPDRSMQIVKGVIAQVEAHKVPWENMCFDSTGQQGAIVDTIEREAGVLGKCIRVNSSGDCEKLGDGTAQTGDGAHGTTA